MIVAGAALLVPIVDAAPAGAAISASSSGTTVTVTMTGDGEADLVCWAGKVRINSTDVSPAVACGALTAITITGDDGAQRVNLHESTGGGLQFTALGTCTANLAGGADVYDECKGADTVSMGEGNDSVLLFADGMPNGSINMGNGSDGLDVWGTNAAETLTAISGNANATVARTEGGVTRFASALSVERLNMNAFGGDDTISATAVVATSGIANGDLSMYGGDGDDTMTTGNKQSSIEGDAGTNHLNGGPQADIIHSDSSTDTINGGGGIDQVLDDKSLHLGGRTLIGPADDDSWFGSATGGDAVVRARPVSATSVRITSSLTRNGQQVLGTTTDLGAVYTQVGSQADDRALGDYVLGSDKRFTFRGDSFDDDLLDVTVPTGTWNVIGTPATNATVDSSAYPDVNVADVGSLSVHGPWTNARQGFAHRVIRDLLFRFPSATERDAIRDQLTAGTTTRAAVVASLMGTSAYRGLDVDRDYIRFLGRASDASGRAYWVGRIASGTSLRLLRAQLLGSNEYFTKAGGTTTKYVTAAYRSVLGRDPDAGGLAYWVGRIDGGAARGSVAEQFLATNESRTAIVTDQFLRFLDRTPTPTESSTWSTTLSTSVTGEQDLIASLAAGDTYYART